LPGGGAGTQTWRYLRGSSGKATNRATKEALVKRQYGREPCFAGCWAKRGGTVSTQVTNADGTEADLVEHLRHIHQKGTKGFTEEYLANLHKTLHQRKRDPLPEHTHPEDAASQEPAEAYGN